GVIEEQEHQMIHGIIEIGDKTVREIMIPRTDIIAVDREAQLRDIVKLFKQHRHTRMPVFERDIDHVIGLIHTKDLLLFYTLSSSRKFDMDKVLRPLEFTPEQRQGERQAHRYPPRWRPGPAAARSARSRRGGRDPGGGADWPPTVTAPSSCASSATARPTASPRS